MLHGKCVCAVFTYELISIRSQTCERCVRVRFVIQPKECVNSIRTHFSWCIMYILCILRFKFLFNDNLWMHLKNALRDIWLALYFFCDSATYTTLSMKTSFAPFWRVNLSMYVINLYSKQHNKRKKQNKSNQNKNCEVAFRHSALVIYQFCRSQKLASNNSIKTPKIKIKKSHENKYRRLIMWLRVSNTWTGKKKRIYKTYLWLVWIAVTALPNKALIHPTAILH